MALKSDEFRAWLNSLEPHADAGFPCDGYDCPIARWLGRDGFEYEVGGFTYKRMFDETCEGEDFGGEFEPQLLPKWARKFVMLVDLKASEPNTIAIHASQALGLLDQVDAHELASSNGGTGKPQSARLAGATSGPAQ